MTRVALVLLAYLALAAPAAGSPQPLADETAAWLSDVLGVEVPRQQVGAFEHGQRQPLWMAASFAVKGSDERVIRTLPRYVGEWSRRRVSVDGGRLLIHELLHGVSLDEGAVEAVAFDLTPSWIARFSTLPTPYAWDFTLTVDNSAYRSLVRNVRARSAAETGKHWKSRDSRLWRRAWVLETGR